VVSTITNNRAILIIVQLTNSLTQKLATSVKTSGSANSSRVARIPTLTTVYALSAFCVGRGAEISNDFGSAFGPARGWSGGRAKRRTLNWRRRNTIETFVGANTWGIVARIAVATV